MILAIDPGPVRSGWVVFGDGRVHSCGVLQNDDLIRKVRACEADELAIEMVASYGMPVGREVFETCVWIGRFVEAWPGDSRFVYRRDVKLELCGTARAKDPNVRAALIDRFGPGRSVAIGTKQNRGPLYGVTGDAWAALAVAVTACVGVDSQ